MQPTKTTHPVKIRLLLTRRAGCADFLHCSWHSLLPGSASTHVANLDKRDDVEDHDQNAENHASAMLRPRRDFCCFSLSLIVSITATLQSANQRRTGMRGKQSTEYDEEVKHGVSEHALGLNHLFIAIRHAPDSDGTEHKDGAEHAREDAIGKATRR